MTPISNLPRFRGVRPLAAGISLCFALAPLPGQPLIRRELRIVISGRMPFLRRLTLIRRVQKIARPHPWPRPAA
jgi:hypothetical protein